jgi:predicted MFS family arabinose efflux permease
MSHPRMAGVVTRLDPARRGQAMGLNAFAVFVGFGTGSLIFQLLLRAGFSAALGAFGVVQLCLAFAAARVFQTEVRVQTA